MTVWNLGSINIDRFYRVPHLPEPGETLPADAYSEGLGGKGANMSVAVARAGAHVRHIGAIGPDGDWVAERLVEYGVDTRSVVALNDVQTAHAIINVDDAGENAIVIWSGASRSIPDTLIKSAMSEAMTGDIFLCQNESNGQVEATRLAQSMGLRVVYAAAPFDAAAVTEIIDRVDLLVLNEVEAQQLSDAMTRSVETLGPKDVVVTKGAAGAVWYHDGTPTKVDAYPAEAVDTTGAGDTFTGYLVAGLDRGMSMAQALDLAAQAGAIMVTRHGTADVIPDLKDIEDARLSR
jgi:ribokinase